MEKKSLLLLWGFLCIVPLGAMVKPDCDANTPKDGQEVVAHQHHFPQLHVTIQHETKDIPQHHRALSDSIVQTKAPEDVSQLQQRQFDQEDDVYRPYYSPGGPYTPRNDGACDCCLDADCCCMVPSIVGIFWLTAWLKKYLEVPQE